MALQPLFPGKVFKRVQFSCMLDICSVTGTLSTPTITEPPSVECQDLLIPHKSMHASWEQECQDLGLQSCPKDKGCTKCCPQGDSNAAPPACQTSTIPLSHSFPFSVTQRSLMGVDMFVIYLQGKCDVMASRQIGPPPVTKMSAT